MYNWVLKKHCAFVSHDLLTAETCSTDEVLSFLREATLMREFDHPNVLTLIGVAIQDNLPLVVLPFMEYGDLKSYVSDQKRVN